MDIKYHFPLRGKESIHASTSGDIVEQIWQELEMLRHLKYAEHLHDKESIVPWVDQAKTYFQDGVKSNWRSAGLLYYYSFLNLAKAYLVAKQKFTYNALNTSSIYHGLHAELQDIQNVAEYKVTVHPPESKRIKGKSCSNVFSLLYEAITGEKWPFSKIIEINVTDFIGYSTDIATEIKALYDLEHSLFQVQSMFRKVEDEWFFEMLIESSGAKILQSHLFSIPIQVVPNENISDLDATHWNLGFNTTPIHFKACKFLRTRRIKESELDILISEIDNALDGCTFPSTQTSPGFLHWLFVPMITLGGETIKWHPILSEYLFSFVMSTILRYQPQLLKNESSNSLLAAAWCKQSAITTLRYFLMFFTKPSVTMNSLT
jgi:hypothetical protein